VRELEAAVRAIVVTFPALVLTLASQVQMCARQPVNTVKISHGNPTVAKADGAIDILARMRSSDQKAEIGMAQPFVPATGSEQLERRLYA
jgi:hypothetical protein